MSLHCRDLWDLVRETVVESGTIQHMTWGFHPEYNCNGVRVFDDLCNATWFQAATAALQDSNTFVVVVILGSDTTSVKSRESAHPIYLPIGNVFRRYRQSRYG